VDLYSLRRVDDVDNVRAGGKLAALNLLSLRAMLNIADVVVGYDGPCWKFLS
jgi:hypothetical protein